MLPAKCVTRAVPTRNLRVDNIQGFQFMLKRLHAFEHNQIYNLYYSLAKFRNGIPRQDLKDLSAKARGNEEWNENAHKDIVSYDMVIDIDSGSHDEIDYAVESAKLIRKVLDEDVVPYHLRFSGMGFHFVIPHSAFPSDLHFNPYEDGSIYQTCKKVAKFFYDEYSEMVDFNIFDSRRIIKLPYSLSIYEDAVYCCKPVIDLDNFELDFFRKFDGRPVGDTIHNQNGNIFNLLKRIG